MTETVILSSIWYNRQARREELRDVGSKDIANRVQSGTLDLYWKLGFLLVWTQPLFSSLTQYAYPLQVRAPLSASVPARM